MYVTRVSSRRKELGSSAEETANEAKTNLANAIPRTNIASGGTIPSETWLIGGGPAGNIVTYCAKDIAPGERGSFAQCRAASGAFLVIT